jgi:4-amino-4-deoxy-L-arabinose transferase-like glycosyltransferase
MPRIPLWIFIVIACIYFTAVRVDTMDVDASQYAEISREMMLSHNWLHIYDRGMNYLDKPPLHFWLSAASMKLFGLNNFGYKLPSILFAIWALFATYKLGKLLYNDTIGRMSALILGSCQGMFLMTNDVRCDTILMSCVITAIWLVQEWATNRKLKFLLAGAAFIALGMMTKGPIALMVPVFCFGTQWLLRREWKNIFNPAHLLAMVVITIMLIPMSIGLYQQFDMHPEKLVNGQTGVSALRFFYWSQSFGRITGESPWYNGAGIDFLMLNMLWSFLPWIILFNIAWIKNVVTLIKQKLRLQASQEWITTGGFLLAYLALGSSGYQLPHYIFIVFPLAAIMTAKYISDTIEANGKTHKVLLRTHVAITALLLLAVLPLTVYVFNGGIPVITLWCTAVAAWLYMAFSKNMTGKLLWLPAAGMIMVNLFLTNFFYVPLLNYQVGSQAGQYFKAQKIDLKTIRAYRTQDPINAIQFYAQGEIKSIDTTADIAPGQVVLTSAQGLETFRGTNINYSVLKQGYFYKVSELTLPFLNPATRAQEAKQYYILQIGN